jgi:hypothetical protein
MSGVPMILWIIIALWSTVLVYVFIDIRRIAVRNNRINAKLLGGAPRQMTERSVLINRCVLVALLVVSDGALLHFGSRLLS